MRSQLRRVRGIARSLAMYHGIPGRHRRLVAFYGQFLAPGDLAFDVGAHVGSRVRAWRRLGVRVVAIEPQPDCLRVLRILFGRDRGVTLLPVALGASPGSARLGISTATPTVSSMAPDWIDSVSADRSFAAVRWDDSVEVPVTTLDALVAEHGVPAFCKIDVEGFEGTVLAGLSRPLPALSVEYLPPAHDATIAVLDRIATLGHTAGPDGSPGAAGYEYAYSPVETMQFTAAPDGGVWTDRAGLEAILSRHRPLGRSGDVYARLVSG